MESRGLPVRPHGNDREQPRYTAGHRGLPWEVPWAPVGRTMGSYGIPSYMGAPIGGSRGIPRKTTEIFITGSVQLRVDQQWWHSTEEQVDLVE